MSVPTDPAGQTLAAERTVSVDLTAFLPDGVELGAGAGPAAEATAVDRTADPEAEQEPTPTVSPWRPDLEALDQVVADLDAVDAALQALDDGTYGSCRACGGPIDDSDLAAAPARTACAVHA